MYGETVFTCAACDAADAVWAVILPGRHVMWCRHLVDSRAEALRADRVLFYRVQSC